MIQSKKDQQIFTLIKRQLESFHLRI